MSDEPPYKDGERISAGALYRRIPNWPNYYRADGPKPRPTGLAFAPDSNEPYTSMALVSFTTAQEMLNNHPGFGLCRIFIEHFPPSVHATYEPKYGRAHVGVWGLAGKGNPAEKVRREMAFAAEMVQAPALPLR